MYEDNGLNAAVGTVRGILVEPGWGACIEFRDDQAQPLSLFQDQPRDHPPGGDDACPVRAECVEKLRCPKIRLKIQNSVPEIDPLENPVHQMYASREDVPQNLPYSAVRRLLQNNGLFLVI